MFSLHLIIRGAGKHRVEGVEITGVAAWHDADHGAKRGPTTIFKLSIDGINIRHLGDLGHLLTPEQAAAIGPVDIVCVPVGGFYTIDAPTAKTVVEQLRARTILPMHYKYDESIKLPIGPVSDFTGFYCGVVAQDHLVAERDSLPEESQVVGLGLA